METESILIVQPSDALLGANVVNVFGTLFSIMAIPTRMPELLLVGRMVGAAGSGVSFGSLILFLQVSVGKCLGRF